MDIWSWICELPNSDEWPESDSPLVLDLASNNKATLAQSIQLQAERTSGSNSEAMVTFSVAILGFHPSNVKKIIWVSDTCPLYSDKPLFLPLVLQLLQEIIIRAPNAQHSTCPRSQLQKLRPDPIIRIMDTHSPESFSSFFHLVFLTRLFWLCACDSPAEVGSLYFQQLLSPNLESLSCSHAPVLRTFFISVGVDVEMCFMRALGYMLAKWFILREVGAGLKSLTPVPSAGLGFSYANEAHGLWIMKGYAPVSAMKLTRFSDQKHHFPIIEAKEAALKYTLAHQQLEAVVQLEYSFEFSEGFIRVKARVDNIRLHVARLGFNKNDDVGFPEERYFPSRVRVWVGPEVGSTYVDGLSLGRSTDNMEKEMETINVVKGGFGKSKVPRVKATRKIATKTKIKSWRCDQDVEGNAAIFDVILHDNKTGHEVAIAEPSIGDDHEGNDFRKRYSGANRLQTKSGGLVLAGDEYGKGVQWRLMKEIEGSVLKWRIGCQIWLSYWPSEVKTKYYETRCVQWCDEVDLPLIPSPSK